MTNNGKYMWIYGATALVVLGGIFLFLSQNKKKEESPDWEAPVQENQGQINVAIQKADTSTPYGRRLQSFLNDKAKKQRLVDELLRAMRGAGTDFKAIKNVLKEIEDENYMRELIRFFHLHEYRYVFGKNEKLNLVQWFKEELSTSEYQEIKDMYPNLL